VLIAELLDSSPAFPFDQLAHEFVVDGGAVLGEVVAQLASERGASLFSRISTFTVRRCG
jgi:hypothetical protein